MHTVAFQQELPGLGVPSTKGKSILKEQDRILHLRSKPLMMEVLLRMPSMTGENAESHEVWKTLWTNLVHSPCSDWILSNHWHFYLSLRAQQLEFLLTEGEQLPMLPKILLLLLSPLLSSCLSSYLCHMSFLTTHMHTHSQIKILVS